MSTLYETFGRPISVYTDGNACEDGELVAINRHDRVTRTVWNWLESTIDMQNPKPPACWPVDLMGFFNAKKPPDRVLAMCRGIIEENRRQAKRVYDENTDGGIFAKFVETKNGKPITLLDSEGLPGGKKLWFVPNDDGSGITLMFPEDY